MSVLWNKSGQVEITAIIHAGSMKVIRSKEISDNSCQDLNQHSPKKTLMELNWFFEMHLRGK